MRNGTSVENFRRNSNVTFVAIMMVLFSCIPVAAESISGFVENVSGDRLSDICIYVQENKCSNVIGSDRTNASGEYQITVSPGTYYLRTWVGCAGSVNLVNEEWTSGGGTADCNQAEAIVVGEGIDVDGKDFQLEAGASISGTLYHSDGTTELTGESSYVNVRTGDPCGHVEHIMNTGVNQVDGSYTLVGLPAGSYYLQTQHWGNHAGFVESWWGENGSSPDCHQATHIEISGTEQLQGKNFSLDLGGTISGTLYHSNGIDPIADNNDLYITLRTGSSACNSNHITSAQVNSDGTYAITGIPAGTHYVEIWNNNSNYIREYWATGGSVRDCQSAEEVDVIAEQTTGSINFQLDVGGSVSGTFYRSDTGNPISNESLGVHVFTKGSNGECDYHQNRVDSSVNADGTYTITGIGTGEYYLHFWRNSTNYIEEFWADDASTQNCADADSFTVTEGESTSNKNFHIEEGASISGTLYESDGSTEITGEDINVDVFSGDPCGHNDYVMDTRVNQADGSYILAGIPAGSYYLRTQNRGSQAGFIESWWGESGSSPDCQQATLIDVSGAEQLQGKNFSLELGASISGTLYYSGGSTEITGEQIRIEVQSGDPCHHHDQVTSTKVNQENGSYTITGLPAGSYYLRTYTYDYSQSFIDSWWGESGSSPDCHQATRIDISGTEQLQDKNFSLEVGASISGTLYESDGSTEITGEDIDVDLFSGDPCGHNDHVMNIGVNQANGSYTLAGISAGSYYLRTQNRGSQAGFVESWWGESGSSPDCQQATRIDVSGAEQVQGKNFSLELGASMSGTLYYSGGSTEITGEQIRIEVQSGDPCHHHDQVTSTEVNQANGSYTITGLPAGSYYLQTYTYDYSQSFIDSWWGESGSSPDCHQATRIDISGTEQLQGKDFSLEVGASISGILYHSDGTTEITGENMGVIARSGDPCGHNEHVSSTGLNQADGSYTLAGISAGSYYLRTQNWGSQAGFIESWWGESGSSPDCQQATRIDVSVAEQLQGKNFSLELGASISGTLYHSDGITRITGEDMGVDVRSGDPCGHNDYVTNTGLNQEDGSYTLAGLPAGSYYLRTQNWGSQAGFIESWWNESGSSPDCNQATSIDISGTEQLQGKNFSLQKGGTISGTLYQTDGTTPITDNNDLHINVRSGGSACDSNHVRGSQVNSDGTYTISGIVSGTYYLEIWNNNSSYLREYWATGESVRSCESAETVNVIAEQVTDSINFQLEEGGGISGTLFLSDGLTPVTGKRLGVNVFKAINNDPCDRDYIAYGSINQNDGTFIVNGIEAGEYYLNTWRNNVDFIREYWAHPESVRSCRDAEKIIVTENIINSGKNFNMELSHSISGTIYTGNTTTPLTGLHGLEVCVVIKDNPCELNWDDRCGDVNETDGTYQIGGISSGASYYASIDFDDDGSQEQYIQERWASSGSVRTCLDAEVIILNDENVENINFNIDSGACAISGTVTTDDGTILNDNHGGILAFQNDPCDNPAFATGEGITEESITGAYRITHLAPGDYYLHTLMNWSQYPNEWWGGTDSTYDCSQAQLVTCTSGQTTEHKNFKLGLGLEHVILMNQILVGGEDRHQTIHTGMDKNSDGRVGMAEVVNAMHALTLERSDFTPELVVGRTFFSIEHESVGGEACILEMTFSDTTVTGKEWVYHADDNWTSGCQEDYFEGTMPYSISDGNILLHFDSEDWPVNLVEVQDDRYIVGDPDDAAHPWYFTKEMVNSLLGP